MIGGINCNYNIPIDPWKFEHERQKKNKKEARLLKKSIYFKGPIL